MRMIDIILKKKHNEELTKEEISFFIKNYVSGVIPDYQVAALLMAINFNGMTKEETTNLTLEIVNSGHVIDLSPVGKKCVDKHSTGGVGDKTSLVIGPMLAALGIPVAKMSGRGLGHTGGTLDKLESFPGFNISLTMEEFMNNVKNHNLAIAGQTGDLAPADKKLYALRDVTGTVESIPLIAASIMSKKLASGSDIIVLDVKTGSGAFMKTEEDSFKLAKAMVDIGTGAGKRVNAVITDMDEPLGYAIGNSLEMIEVIDTLKGEGPKDLLDVSIFLAAQIVVLYGMADTIEKAQALLQKTITDSSAYNKMRELLEIQGSSAKYVDNYDLLEKAKFVIDVVSDRDGYVSHINAEEIGISAMILGAGRETKDASIDYSVGIILTAKVDSKVKKGDIIARLHSNTQDVEKVKARVLGAYTFSEKEIEKKPLIKGVVTAERVEKY